MTNFDMCTHVRNIMKNAPTLDFHSFTVWKKIKKIEMDFRTCSSRTRLKADSAMFCVESKQFEKIKVKINESVC